MSLLIKGMEMPKMPEELISGEKIPYIDVRIFADGTAATSNSKSPYYMEYGVVELPDEAEEKGCVLAPQEKYEGLKRKYVVLKADGDEVKNCFVLRPDKDKAAIAALLTYADTTKNQVLAADIRKWISTIIPAEEVET